MFFDMTFWPAAVCYCRHCAARFRKEQGKPLPRIVDWDDPHVARVPEGAPELAAGVCQDVTATAKQARPGITVNHQFSTIFHNWTMGVPLELTEACDYVGGDFYGGPAQHSLACKVYHGLTRRRPFEFHTSRTRIFTDHVTVKPMEEIRTESFVATLHSAALMIVDYINADGTLNREAHEFLGKLERRACRVRAIPRRRPAGRRGDLFRQEVALQSVRERRRAAQARGRRRLPASRSTIGGHGEEAPGGAHSVRRRDQCEPRPAESLSRRHPSLGPGDDPGAGRHLPQVRGRRRGLYASGPSSVERLTAPAPRFLLEDVLGVRFKGYKNHSIFYLTPVTRPSRRPSGRRTTSAIPGHSSRPRRCPAAEVLARITLPFVDPGLGRNIGSRFAAIHSNPPALKTGDEPAAVFHRFGKGQAVWAACGVEGSEEWVDRQFVLSLLKRALPGPYRFELEAHPAVEMTLFHQPERKRLLATLLNLQRQLPQVPVPATVCVLPLPGQRVQRVLRLPQQAPVTFVDAKPYVEFRVEPFDTLAMFALDYE